MFPPSIVRASETHPALPICGNCRITILFTAADRTDKATYRADIAADRTGKATGAGKDWTSSGADGIDTSAEGIS